MQTLQRVSGLGTMSFLCFFLYRFSPEDLGVIGSSALAWYLLELFVIYALTFILSINASFRSFIDVFAFCGYKFYSLVPKNFLIQNKIFVWRNLRCSAVFGHIPNVDLKNSLENTWNAFLLSLITMLLQDDASPFIEPSRRKLWILCRMDLHKHHICLFPSKCTFLNLWLIFLFFLKIH